MAIRVDFCNLFASVYECGENEFPKWTGSLNRHTGEIICFINYFDSEKYVGREEAIKFASYRARIDAAPAEWVEIPKIDDQPVRTAEAEAAHFNAFVAEFFRKNSIEAEVVQCPSIYESV